MSYTRNQESYSHKSCQCNCVFLLLYKVIFDTVFQSFTQIEHEMGQTRDLSLLWTFTHIFLSYLLYSVLKRKQLLVIYNTHDEPHLKPSVVEFDKSSFYPKNNRSSKICVFPLEIA